MIETQTERTKRLVAMGEMAASLAHEIRNPLGSLELYCSLLKRDLAESPGPLKLLEQMYESILRLNQVINNSLQFSRDIRLQRRPVVSTEALLQKVKKEAEARAIQSGVEIKLCMVADSQPTLDSDLMHQALLNLVLNAIDAAAQSKPCGVVELRALGSVKIVGREGNYWVVEVSDNGRGIAGEALPRIFDPFFTTKSTGTGLGLAVVHSIVESHAGLISIETEEGEGTTFRLEIPAAEMEI